MNGFRIPGLLLLAAALLLTPVAAFAAQSDTEARPPCQVAAYAAVPADSNRSPAPQELDNDGQRLLACPANCRRRCQQVFYNCRASRRECLARRSACLQSCGC